jgi:hypothetical protein
MQLQKQRFLSESLYRSNKSLSIIKIQTYTKLYTASTPTKIN